MFSKTGYIIFNSAVFAIFLLLLAFEVLRGRVKLPGVLAKAGIVLGWSLLVLLVGEAVAYSCAFASGAKFNLFGIVAGVEYDNVAMVAFIAVMAVSSVLVYMAGRRKAIR